MIKKPKLLIMLVILVAGTLILTNHLGVKRKQAEDAKMQKIVKETANTIVNESVSK